MLVLRRITANKTISVLPWQIFLQIWHIYKWLCFSIYIILGKVLSGLTQADEMRILFNPILVRTFHNVLFFIVKDMTNDQHFGTVILELIGRLA